MGAGIFGPGVLPWSEGAKTVAFIACVSVAILFILVGAIKELNAENVDRYKLGRRRRVISLYGMAVCGAGFLGFLGAYFWPFLQTEALSPIKESSSVERNPLTLRQIFDSDFEGLARIFTMQSAFSGSSVEKFPVTEYLDVYTNSYFLSVYISRIQDATVVSDIIVRGLEAIVANLAQIEFEVTISGDTKRCSNSTMRFSGQIYLYLENDLPLMAKANIEKLYEDFGYHVHILSSAYHALHWKEYDRVPHSAEDAGGMGAQLPRVKTGDFVTIRNKTGSLPPSTTSPQAAPPSPAPLK